ncbi:hypothetical protein EN781_00255 [Mesorhizobium sp. M4A.F.Ca.ET.090.04.2.1]|uniref:hypothetical protein n=1 Tax=Mesorhizobium sp. M4A.F.Ca.ET.090.04.2.1 TaxID=2496663 RepID=UPI000FCCA74F|nr:hypothetical protein [Mesorhizobium sp. M4A.F.Ca.ET.090.04.2.1]RVC47603.1 hypothetical protein EN781_00255 [Mesorhizobium sp. M4A.F.Ca.ET.090.04.2.1]
MKLPGIEVLAAVATAVSPRGAYINDQVQRAHAKAVKAGAIGHPPSTGLVLRRLRSLEKRGLIECVGGPDGYYGFEWRITDAGRAELARRAS